MTAKERLLVALDVDTPGRAVSLANQLRGRVGGFKIGSQLFTLGGPLVVREVGPTFLDLKYHDIPNTVAKSAIAAAELGVTMFNVHCLGGFEMMYAARKALDNFSSYHGTAPLCIGVTLLTSHDQESLKRLRIGAIWGSIPDIVSDLALLAYEAGLNGVVCSPLEIEVVRKRVSDRGFVIVTPGIRSTLDEKGDQKRTMTAKQAMAAGADYLVVGRPIIAQPDPVAAAEAIVADMEAGLAERSAV